MEGTDEHIVDATIKSDSLGVQTLPAVNIEANTEVCYSDIAASTWTLYGCDGGSASCDSSNAAVTITDIVVTDIVSTSTTSSATIIAVSTTSIPTSKCNILYQYRPDVYFIVSISSTIIPSPDTSSALLVLDIVNVAIITACIIIIIVLGNVYYIFIYLCIMLLCTILVIIKAKQTIANKKSSTSARDNVSGVGLLDPPSNAGETPTDAQPPKQVNYNNIIMYKYYVNVYTLDYTTIC